MNKVKTLQRLREVQSQHGRRHHRCFSIEGYRLIERGLRSSAQFLAVLLDQRLMDAPSKREQDILEQLSQRSIPLYTGSSEELYPFLENRTFGSILGLVQEIPPATLTRWEQDPKADCKFLVVVDAKDPGNLGAMMRTARASGVDTMLVVQGTDPFHPKAARTSMGAIFDLPILSVADGPELITSLQRLQIQTIAAVVDNGIPPYVGTVSSRHALFMGSEAHGLPLAWHPLFDLRWSIPMHEDIDSFSINAATSILLYETNRRMWCPATSTPS